MYDVHSQEFNYHYQRSKLKVKLWEDQFKRENGRTPTKVDIKASDAKTRHYYKIYWKLKTMLLEETILGSPKESSPLTRCKSDNVLKEHTNIIEDKGSVLNKSGTGSSARNMKENDGNQSGKTESKTWGTHLNKAKSAPLELDSSGVMNWSMSDKLFEGSKFKKRNPRKALKQAKSNTSVTSTETIASLDSAALSSVKSNLSLSSVDSFQAAFSPCPDTQDELSPAEPFSVESDCSPKIKALIMSKTELSPMLNKSDRYKVVSEPAPICNQPISLIQQLASDPKKDFQPARKLDVRWLERCSEGGGNADLKSSDSGFESVESSMVDSPPESGAADDAKAIDDDDDDIIASSDNESNENSRLSLLPVKRKIEDSPPMTSVAVAPTPSPPVPEDADKAIEQPRKRVKLDPYALPAETTPAPSAKEARIQKKIKSGTLNENYVRIDIKKKVYVRGKRNFNFTKHKKKQWKNLKKNLDADENGGGIIRCYKCGDAGHFARYCQKMMDKLLPDDLDVEEEEESTLPTLEEAEAMAKEKNVKKKNVLLPVVTEVEVEADEPCKGVEPLYELDDDNEPMATPPEVFEALRKFGHSRFRPGQEQAIMRILSGQSTLVTIATGGGKSLCYQLPAYLYAMRAKCLTLVVSPLVSLMEDQVSGSSSFFKLGCLHTNQTAKQRQSVIDDAKNGKLFALLVSPEAVVSGDNSSGLCSILKTLPPIAFACIDEVHCVSQWSHNFRPSYLMLTKVLKEKLGVKTILGLTATATKSTIGSITKELGIADRNGVIKDIPLPDNLCLSMSQDEHKDKALLELLKGPRFKDANAILIYCTRRDECERLAVLIRTIHNDHTNPLANGRKRLSWNAESYHAGMSSARRKQVQKAFMKGHLRIVVATIAFGMGINKQDIRGVIHYNMPRDFESYVQEVGRAGRDGMLAHCHLFLDTNGRDLNELRRHIHSNAVDRHVLRKLLQRVFVECKCKERGRTCPGHEVAFDCGETVQALDIPEENIHTLLCYLELHPDRLIKVLTPGFMNCKIQSYRGAKAITAAAKKCPPLAVACALNPNALKEVNTSSLTVNVVNVANAISWDSGSVKNQLKGIEWSQGKDEKWKKSGILVEFFGLGFRLLSRGDMTPQELDEALNYLIQRVTDQEKRSSEQLDITFSALTHFSSSSYKECLEDYVKEKSDSLKNVIREYFETEELTGEIPMKRLQVQDFDEEEVASDVRALICSYRDNSFNGRAVARIFHGIQSPMYPASIWYKCRHWRQHIDKDFNRICRVATKEILRFK